MLFQAVKKQRSLLLCGISRLHSADKLTADDQQSPATNVNYVTTRACPVERERQWLKGVYGSRDTDFSSDGDIEVTGMKPGKAPFRRLEIRLEMAHLPRA